MTDSIFDVGDELRSRITMAIAEVLVTLAPSCRDYRKLVILRGLWLLPKQTRNDLIRARTFAYLHKYLAIGDELTRILDES